MKKILFAVVVFSPVMWLGFCARWAQAQPFPQANQAQMRAQLESASRDPNNPTRALAAHALRINQRQQEVAARMSALGCGGNSAPTCKCLENYSASLLTESQQYPADFQQCAMRELPKIAPVSGGPRPSPPELNRILNEVCGKALKTEILDNPPSCLGGHDGVAPASAAAGSTSSAPELQGPLPSFRCYPEVLVETWRGREQSLVDETRRLQNRTRANINLIKEHYHEQEQFWEKNRQNTKRIVLAISAARKLATGTNLATRILAVLPDLTQMVQQEFDFQGLISVREKKALTMVKSAGDFQEVQIAIAKDIFEKSRGAIENQKLTSPSTIGKIISGIVIDEAVEKAFEALQASDEKKRNDEILAVVELAARHSQQISTELRFLRARIAEMKAKPCASRR